MTAPVSSRVYTMLGISAALHALALAAAHRPAFEFARPGAFEPIEIELLGTAAARPASPRRPPVAAATARAATASEPAPAAASGSDPGDGAPGAEAMVEAAGGPSLARGPRLDRIVEARADVAALNNPKPAYPLAARRRGLQGRVLIAAHVRADGACAEVRLQRTSGHTLLDQSALDAVRHWHFLPARRAGVAIDSWVEVPVSFRLDG